MPAESSKANKDPETLNHANKAILESAHKTETSPAKERKIGKMRAVPETLVMARIIRQLDDLPANQARGIVSYLSTRYDGPAS